MMEDIDTRPEIAPDCFSFRELPADGDMGAIQREIGEQWNGQIEWCRFTIVSDEHPNPPYPHGVYFEGWSKAPHRHDPPGKCAPFNYPLVAADEAA
jgi:hypothetical protein